MQVREAACVRIVEISMWEFSGHYPFSRLAQHSIVVGNPPAVDKRKKIGTGCQPEDQTDSRTRRSPVPHTHQRLAGRTDIQPVGGLGEPSKVVARGDSSRGGTISTTSARVTPGKR